MNKNRVPFYLSVCAVILAAAALSIQISRATESSNNNPTDTSAIELIDTETVTKDKSLSSAEVQRISSLATDEVLQKIKTGEIGIDTKNAEELIKNNLYAEFSNVFRDIDAVAKNNETAINDANAWAEKIYQRLKNNTNITVSKESLNKIAQEVLKLVQSEQLTRSEIEQIVAEKMASSEKYYGGGSSGIKDTMTVTAKNGKDGENGKNGYTPVKGVDYFTESDVNSIVKVIEEDLGSGIITISGSGGSSSATGSEDTNYELAIKQLYENDISSGKYNPEYEQDSKNDISNWLKSRMIHYSYDETTNTLHFNAG